MARPSSRYPTDLELEILKILWHNGTATVRQVKEQLADFRNLAHTSVMTIMTIMTEKGYLKRTKKGLGYIYKPSVNREETIRSILSDIVDRAFLGSTMAAMAHLLEISDVDEKEFAEMRKLIRKKERGEL